MEDTSFTPSLLEIAALTPEGEPTYAPMPLDEVARALREGLLALEGGGRAVARGRRRWRLLLPQEPSSGPPLRELEQALEPLSRHRQALKPLYYAPPPGLPGEKAFMRWEEELATQLSKEEQYLVLAGPLADLPHGLQLHLSLNHVTGRLAFSEAGGYSRYAERVVAAERSAFAPASHRALLFGPAHDGPTRFTRELVVGPLEQKLAHRKRGLNLRCLWEREATRANLLSELSEIQGPTLLMTGSHGCEDSRPDSHMLGALADHHRRFVTAADVAALPACLENGIAVLFACNSMGASGERGTALIPTAESRAARLPDRAALLPQAMLDHPRGPLAVLGHVDPILLVGLQDLERRFPTTPDHASLQPVYGLMERLISGESIGAATWTVRRKAVTRLNQLRMLLEQQRHASQPLTPGDDRLLTEVWIAWNDARGWATLGDPAVALNKRRRA